MIMLKLSIAAWLLKVVAAQVAPFDWSTIAPSTELSWVPCYSEQTQCTRLNVPLNYSNPEAGSTALALIRIPAASAGSPTYKGPLLLNPGGPGGSGIDLVNALGSGLAASVGPDFDILSWDPRGVGETTPQVTIFHDANERKAFGFGFTSWDLDYRSDRVEDQWARMQVLGRLAQDRDTGILAHLTTDNVARDMLTIVKAHGREKVNYWGFSYGTVLGATFATLFPDKIERMIIDGVVDFDGHYKGDQAHELIDADKSLGIFLDECHKVGASVCPFFKKSRAAMGRAVRELFARVAKQPIPAYSPDLPAYGTINLPALKTGILAALYTPSATYFTLGAALAELESGNGSILIQLASIDSIDPLPAITCADAVPVTDSAKELREYAKRIDHLSSFQSIIASARLLCSGWRVHPKSFKGPIMGNTSYPLLIIGNTADHVTPLANAKTASRKFPGSVVLQQDTPGHTSLAVTSECTLATVHAYLNDGTLPKAGTICPFNGTYFVLPANTKSSDITSRSSSEHERFVNAADVIHAAVSKNPRIFRAF